MDKEDFQTKVLAAEQSMYRIARSILSNEEDTADAMQNAILAAYSSLDSLRQEAYFQTWLTRILINECYSLARKRSRQISYEESITEKEEQISGKEGYSEVFLEIQNLEKKYRIPFVLYYVEGYSVSEIAKVLHISEGAVRTRLYRSRNLLKKIYKE